MRPDEVRRIQNEAERRAAGAVSSAARTAGPQDPNGVTTGIFLADVWTPFGRVGITEPKDGFLPRRTS